MPRAPRIDIPGLTYHVISRGVKQLPICHADEDRHQLLRCLFTAQKKLPFILQQYCLMDNHYHFLIKTIVAPLSKIMHRFKSDFAGYFNRKYDLVGHVFQGRFHSIPVETDTYFTTVSRYIHLNPVRAGIVDRPEDYPWSNYRTLIRGEKDPLADPSELLAYFGEDPRIQRERYREFVEDMIGKEEAITDTLLMSKQSWGQLPEKVACE
jgi:putative transposase